MLNTLKKSRKLKGLLIILLSLYLMLGSSLYFLQEKLIFRPTPLDQDFVYSFNHNFEELFFNTPDGATLNALHFKSLDPKGVILYFHGNAGNLARWGKITEYFVDLNYDVLVMDYRTYGKSTGKLSEQALYDDALLFYKFLIKSYDPSEIILYGRSLGTGLATKLASKVNINQLILETPFYSIEDVAKSRFPIFPVGSLLQYELPSYKYLNSVKCPVTIIHGTSDGVVPYESGLKLAESTNIPVKFVKIEGGSHNNLVSFNRYHETIKACLN
ncbi:MAG: alpha/beta hydrolase [Winogradskyella sp.]|nr:alpha/beta hydrolase [Winogradskyella sp.]